MKKQSVCFLLGSIFLIIQMYPVFCMEKRGKNKKKQQEKPFCWLDFKADFFVPGDIEKAFNNDRSKPGAYFPPEIKQKIAKKLRPLKQLFGLGFCKEYIVPSGGFGYDIQALYVGQTWAPGPEKIEAGPGKKCSPQCQFWFKGVNSFRFDDDKEEKVNAFCVKDTKNKGTICVEEKSIKFDGQNSEGYGIFFYEDQFNDAYLNLISINAFKKNTSINPFKKRKYATVDLKQSRCDALALGEKSCVVGITEKGDQGQNSFVQLYKIVKKWNKVRLIHSNTIAVPTFKKFEYLRPEILIGLTQDGKIFTIVPDDVGKIVDGKPKQVFYLQKIKYNIEDFAVHAENKKQLVLRTKKNDIFFADLSFLKMGIPCFRKKLSGKYLYRNNEMLPKKDHKRDFCITNMWFGKNRFEYLYKTARLKNYTIKHYKNWVRYEIKEGDFLPKEDDYIEVELESGRLYANKQT
jgi:hypothetical protein